MSFGDDFGGHAVHYECCRCGTQMTGQDLDDRGGYVKCINCGYKVLKKTRTPIVRRVKAR